MLGLLNFGYETEKKMTDSPSNAAIVALLDEQAIKNVAHLFARGLDRMDRDLIKSCFHEDGTDDHGVFKGTVDEFCAWVFPPLENYDATQHIISTQIVEINGEKGVCESYFYARHALKVDGVPKELIAAGRYLDTMEKRKGVWKISHRKAIFDWNRLVDDMAIPSRPEMDEVMTRGEQGTGDASYAAFMSLEK